MEQNELSFRTVEDNNIPFAIVDENIFEIESIFIHTFSPFTRSYEFRALKSLIESTYSVFNLRTPNSKLF